MRVICDGLVSFVIARQLIGRGIRRDCWTFLAAASCATIRLKRARTQRLRIRIVRGPLSTKDLVLINSPSLLFKRLRTVPLHWRLFKLSGDSRRQKRKESGSFAFCSSSKALPDIS